MQLDDMLSAIQLDFNYVYYIYTFVLYLHVAQLSPILLHLRDEQKPQVQLHFVDTKKVTTVTHMCLM